MTKYYCDRCGALVKNNASLVGILAIRYTFTIEEEKDVLGEVCIKCLADIKRELHTNER